MSESASTQEKVQIAADIVSAYVSKNAVPQADLPELIRSVFAALGGLNGEQTAEVAEAPVPPVSIRKSLTPDYIISLEDGKQYRSLKRHLTVRGLTPEQYRAKWGLPSSYPMVAPNYAKQRSELAKSLGLGQMGRKKQETKAPSEQNAAKRSRKAAG